MVIPLLVWFTSGVLSLRSIQRISRVSNNNNFPVVFEEKIIISSEKARQPSIYKMLQSQKSSITHFLLQGSVAAIFEVIMHNLRGIIFYWLELDPNNWNVTMLTGLHIL